MGTNILKALLPASFTLKIYTADVGALLLNYQTTQSLVTEDHNVY